MVFSCALRSPTSLTRGATARHGGESVTPAAEEVTSFSSAGSGKATKQQPGATTLGLRKEPSAASSFPRSGALALCACAARRPAQVPTEVAGCWRQRRAAAKPRAVAGAVLNPEVVAVPGEQAETAASRTPGWLSGAGADREHPPRGSCMRSGSGRACLPRLSERPVMAMVMAAVARTAPVKLRPKRWEAGRVAVRAGVCRPPFQALLPGNYFRLLEPIELPGAGLETDLVEPLFFVPSLCHFCRDEGWSRSCFLHL